jgi:outer membrane receptor protein involved in Fe transport
MSIFPLIVGVKEGESMHKRIYQSVWILCILLLGSSPSFAATTGKISGSVVDSQSGESLPGVNIVIEGTTMGAASNVDGDYFIINIPPGSYQVRANMMGYTPKVVTDVVVRIDRTTNIDFELTPEVLQAGEEVVVTAEREIVRQDISYTQTNLGEEELDAIPAAYNLDQALTSQVGVGYDAQGLTIRRSNNQEISFVVDGMVLKDERTQRPYQGVSKTAVSEVQLLTGAFSAEYGDARAGVVNVVTKQPKQTYSISFESQISPLMGGDDSEFPGLKHFGPYIYSNDNWYEYGRFDWNGGAPAADRNKDGDPDFMGWNQWAANNTYNDQTLTPEQAFAIWAWHHRSENKNGQVLYDGIPFSQYKVGNQTLADLVKPMDSRYANLEAGSNPHPLNWYAYDPDYNMDMTLTGPVPGLGNKLGFVLSHRREHTMMPYFAGQSAYQDNSTQLKMIWNINPDMKLTGTGMYSDMRQAHRGDFTGSLEAARPTHESMLGVWDNNDRVYKMDSELIPRGTFYTFAGLKWTHTLSPSTFYEIGTQHTWIHYNAQPNARRRDTSPMIQIGPVMLAEEPRNWSYQSGVGSDMLSLYGLRGGREFDFSNTRMFRIEGDITSQININHQLKAGFEFAYNHIQELRGYVEHPEYYIVSGYAAGADGVMGTADDRARGDQANWHEYTVFPVQGALWAQDRMEYGGMILTAGLRADFYQPHRVGFDRNDIFMPNGAEYWDKHFKHYGDNAPNPNYYGLEPDTSPPLQVYLSPRLGVSHPIGPESKIYFNYGHFYQMPNFRDTYQFQLGVDEPLEDYPNYWLKMPRTVNFEVGYEQRLAENYVITLRGFYKDVTQDLMNEGLDSRGQGDPSYTTNTLAKDIKGVEIMVEKKYGDFITGFINADYSNERRSEYGWDDIRHPEHPNIIRDYYNTQDLRIIDSYTNATRYSRGTWQIKANISLHTPSDFGPGELFLGSKPLGMWDVQIFHRWNQGGWFSWNPFGLRNLVNVDNHQYKDYNKTDLHIEKQFRFAGIAAGAYMEIWNLFNVKNGHDSDGFVSRMDRGYDDEFEKAYARDIFDNGKRWGDEPESANAYLIQRPYIFWSQPRDYWFGLRFYF